MIVEAKRHPRHKLCGGALVRSGDVILKNLGLGREVPSFPLTAAVFRYERDLIRTALDARVVRRHEFDASLAEQVRRLGFPIIEAAPVRNVMDRGNAVEVTTDQFRIEAKVVVAADGANSIVRRKLRWPGGSHVARLLEVLTPAPRDHILVEERIALFDFSGWSKNMPGYYWDFPCLESAEPHINSGVFDSRVGESNSHPNLPQILRAGLRRRRVDPSQVTVEGAPIRWYHPEAHCSRPRTLLAGDAAGVDPMLGEGISFALAYGEVAAEAITRAFDRNDFSFAGYDEAIHKHWLLGRLRKLYYVASHFSESRDPWRDMLALFAMLADRP